MGVFGSLTTELRIAFRIGRETFMGLKRTGWMNLVIITTMACILSIFGVLLAIMIQMSLFMKNMGSELEISVYLKNSTDMEQFEQHLEQDLPGLIERITLVPKKMAWEDMQKQFLTPDLENPLPDTMHIRMKTQDQIEPAVVKLKTYPEIESLQYAKDILQKIKGITRGVSLAGMIISFFLGVLTLFIISNTIHLLIQAKTREIEILRMMGVGNWYIRLPFLFQGAAYGLSGACLAYIPLSIAMFYFDLLVDMIGFETNAFTTHYVFILLILMGMLVGSGGSALAVRKHLRV
jgi:cell division transport system permease protein